MIGAARITITISGEVAFAVMSMSEMNGLISGKSDVTQDRRHIFSCFSA
jgi:hypothetical protein